MDGQRFPSYERVWTSARRSLFVAGAPGALLANIWDTSKRQRFPFYEGVWAPARRSPFGVDAPHALLASTCDTGRPLDGQRFPSYERAWAPARRSLFGADAPYALLASTWDTSKRQRFPSYERVCGPLPDVLRLGPARHALCCRLLHEPLAGCPWGAHRGGAAAPGPQPSCSII